LWLINGKLTVNQRLINGGDSREIMKEESEKHVAGIAKLSVI
jgi:hypothetical protein